MFDILGVVNKRIWRVIEQNIDNPIFQCHYRHTVVLLLTAALLVFFKQYFGEMIQCQVNANSKSISTDYINNYCWVNSTHTLESTVPDPVYRELPGGGAKTSNSIINRHNYYQWVGFVLALQAIAFYLPHFLWKNWETGRIKALAGNMRVLISKNDQKQDSLVAYFLKNFHTHNMYFLKFVICEILNWANVLTQIFLTDIFLRGHFRKYGSEYLKTLEPGEISVSDKVFPVVTKCHVLYYGNVPMSRNIEEIDALCVMPVNIIHEKIFVVLWFWYVILSVLSGLVILYRAIIFLWPDGRWIVLRARSRLADGDYARIVHRRCQIGDWFVLSQLSKNIDGAAFGEFLNELGRRLEGRHKNSV